MGNARGHTLLKWGQWTEKIADSYWEKMVAWKKMLEFHAQHALGFRHAKRALESFWNLMWLLRSWICIIYYFRTDFRSASSQWETSIQSNAISHWQGTSLESALYFICTFIFAICITLGHCDDAGVGIYYRFYLNVKTCVCIEYDFSTLKHYRLLECVTTEDQRSNKYVSLGPEELQ